MTQCCVACMVACSLLVRLHSQHSPLPPPSRAEFTPVGLRDQSDKQSGQGSGGGPAGSGGTEGHVEEKRSHPVARTAGTAIGTAAGTVLGAVGGPVGAAAGATLGASVGRGLTDLMSGTKEQAEVYEGVSHIRGAGGGGGGGGEVIERLSHEGSSIWEARSLESEPSRRVLVLEEADRVFNLEWVGKS